MARIPQCPARHNTKRRPIFPHPEIIPPDEPPVLHPDVQKRLTRRSAAVYQLIRKSIIKGSSSVTLRQIDIADQLDLSAVTVRRHTGRLQQAGLINAERTQNAIRFSIPGPSSAPPDRAEASTKLPIKDPAEQPTHHQTDSRASRPICPQHKASRRSDYSDILGALIHHCTGFIDGARCSWLHATEHGTVRQPGLTEWKTADIAEFLNNPAITSNSEKPGTISPPTATPDKPGEPPAPEHKIWLRTIQRLSETMQDHYVDRYLAPTRALALKDATTLVVQTGCPQDVQWLALPLNQRWSDNALSEVLQQIGTVQYVHMNSHVDQ